MARWPKTEQSIKELIGTIWTDAGRDPRELKEIWLAENRKRCCNWSDAMEYEITDHRYAKVYLGRAKIYDAGCGDYNAYRKLVRIIRSEECWISPPADLSTTL